MHRVALSAFSALSAVDSATKRGYRNERPRLIPVRTYAEIKMESAESAESAAPCNIVIIFLWMTVGR